jgi:hypothetical protein
LSEPQEAPTQVDFRGMNQMPKPVWRVDAGLPGGGLMRAVQAAS